MIDGDVRADEVRGPAGDLVIGERIHTGWGRLKEVSVASIEHDQVDLGDGDILRRILITVDDEIVVGTTLPVKVPYILQGDEPEPTGEGMRLRSLQVVASLREFMRLSDDEQETMVREFEESLVVSPEDYARVHGKFTHYRPYLRSLIKNRRFDEVKERAS